MKKTMFIMLAVMFVITACKKDEPETLAGTSWGTEINQTHTENGKTYPYVRKVDLNFSTSTGTLLMNSATLPDNITLDALALPFSYTYNPDNKEGVATLAGGQTATFSISGNTLKMSAEMQPGISVSMDFVKK